MGLNSVNAQNASLNNDYGATKGPNAAAAHVVALYAGDPAGAGVELDSAGGYTRPLVTNNGTNWPGAAGGATQSAVIAFADPTGEWTVAGSPAVADYFQLIDSTTGDFWDSGLLADPISVDAAGEPVHTQLTVYYDNTGA